MAALRMTHQQQERAGNCGQACVAMITGQAQAAVEKQLRMRGGTHYCDLRRVLKHYGVALGGAVRTRAEFPKLPARAICMTRDRKTKRGHWIVHDDGMIYDPAAMGPVTLRTYIYFTGTRWRITSFAEAA